MSQLAFSRVSLVTVGSMNMRWNLENMCWKGLTYFRLGDFTVINLNGSVFEM